MFSISLILSYFIFATYWLFWSLLLSILERFLLGASESESLLSISLSYFLLGLSANSSLTVIYFVLGFYEEGYSCLIKDDLLFEMLLSLPIPIAYKFRDICYCLKSLIVSFLSAESESFLLDVNLFLGGSLELDFCISLGLLIGSNRTSDLSFFL